MFHVSRKVLCLDDQREILDLLGHQLGNDYQCVFATSAEQALERIDSEGAFAVAVVDYNLPGIDGIEFLARLRERSPQTVPVMLTAYDDLDIAIEALHQGNIFRFLRKPWDESVLRRCLDDALEQHRVVVTERLLSGALSEANRTLKTKVEQLERANRLLEYWVEFSPAVIYSAKVVDGRLQPSYVSRNFARLTGVERTALAVDPGFWVKQIHPEDVERVREHVAAALAGSSDSCAIEYRVRHDDGGWREVYDSFRITRDHAGRALEVVGAWMDRSAVAAGGAGPGP